MGAAASSMPQKMDEQQFMAAAAEAYAALKAEDGTVDKTQLTMSTAGADNIILLSDSYKVSHWKQYPPNTSVVYSYFESRGGKYSEVCFFGLQYILKKYLLGPVVTKAKIDQAEAIYQAHFMGEQFYREGWEYILSEYNGHLPVKICAVPEGTVVDAKTPLMTVENTDPKCFWLTNFLETLLVQVWAPMTVATHSREQKKVLQAYLEKTADEGAIAGLGFKLHDFGFRGVSSVETAGINGAGHLVNFIGTDTVAAMNVAIEYYGAPCGPNPTPDVFPPFLCPGYSIPASEHSTITSWTKDGEIDALRNMLIQYPTGIVACVSDSFDVFKACSDMWGTELKELVLGRDGVLVVRPDSGDPATTALKCLEILGEKIGMSENTKGYKMLDPHVRMIWGDGIDYESLQEILSTIAAAGWSSDNMAFGSGGGLLQKLNRDTQKCAFKCAMAVVDGEEREVFKDPITDPGKKSKKGRLSVHQVDGGWVTKMGAEADEATSAIQPVYENGVLLSECTWAEVTGRAAIASPSPYVIPEAAAEA